MRRAAEQGGQAAHRRGRDLPRPVIAATRKRPRRRSPPRPCQRGGPRVGNVTGLGTRGMSTASGERGYPICLPSRRLAYANDARTPN